MSLYSWQQPLWKKLWQEGGLNHHALLIQGRNGIGKRDFAYALAQSLLCENLDTKTHQACGTCEACHWFSQGNHPDFRLVEPASLQEESAEADSDDSKTSDKPDKKASSQIAIGQIRELEDFVSISTHRDGYRVIMLNPAEAMNANAANAILKMLEEPPANTRFLLVTSEPRRLLPTVISRCRRVEMAMPEKKVSQQWLAEQGIEQADSLLAQSGDAPLAALKLADGEYQAGRREWLQGLAQGKSTPFMMLAEGQQKQPLVQPVNWMQTWCYDLLAIKSGAQARYNVDYTDALTKLAQNLSTQKLLEWENLLKSAKRFATHPLNARLFLEQLLMSYTGCFR
jgi:DNA polymerase III subunit delta'